MDNVNERHSKIPHKYNPGKVLFISFLVMLTFIGFMIFKKPSIRPFRLVESILESPTDKKKRVIDFKSDAELVADYQAGREDFRQILEQVAQTTKEIKQHNSPLYEQNETLRRELIQNNEINRNSEKPKVAEKKRLSDEMDRNLTLINKFTKEKELQIYNALEKIGYRAYKSREDYIKIYKYYQHDELPFALGDTHRIEYRVEKGYVLFTENKGPDPQFVVDTIDNFHSSNNIRTATEELLSEYGRKNKGFDEVYIYVHIEGNLYLYFYASQTEIIPMSEAG